MAKKYIDVNELNANLDIMRIPNSEYATDDYIDGFTDGVSAVMSEISKIPSIDVAPVKHGEWMGTVCTACGESTSFYYDCCYCPNCGAKMD